MANKILTGLAALTLYSCATINRGDVNAYPKTYEIGGERITYREECIKKDDESVLVTTLTLVEPDTIGVDACIISNSRNACKSAGNCSKLWLMLSEEDRINHDQEWERCTN